MNAPIRTVASAGTRSPKKTAVSASATTKTTHGPILIRSPMMAGGRDSTGGPLPSGHGDPDVVRGATLAIRTGGTADQRIWCHDQIVGRAPRVVAAAAGYVFLHHVRGEARRVGQRLAHLRRLPEAT